MACRIELINPKTNKSVKSITVNMTYKESETHVLQLNSVIKNERFWKVTEINI